MLALFGISFMLPFYFEELRGFSIETSGLLLTPLPLTIAVVAPLSGALADRFGSRWLASGGLALACLGLLLLARLDATSTIGDIVWRLILTGIGQGLFQSPNTRALMNSAPGGAEGEVSGLLTTARVVGQSLSVALAGAIFASLGGDAAGRAIAVARASAPARRRPLQQTFLTGFQGGSWSKPPSPRSASSPRSFAATNEGSPPRARRAPLREALNAAIGEWPPDHRATFMSTTSAPFRAAAASQSVREGGET